jgi:hypothetical protein
MALEALIALEFPGLPFHGQPPTVAPHASPDSMKNWTAMSVRSGWRP